MADFDLTQTDAQVQSILNDGQNMQGAGAQTTLTTESVLLKDVNGNYHKILKSSFTEAIRDTLAGLLVNNDKGTTINQIAAIANGDFGSITPANLASVLGGKKEMLMAIGLTYQDRVVCNQNEAKKTSVPFCTGLYCVGISTNQNENIRTSPSLLYLIKNNEGTVERLTTNWFAVNISNVDGFVALTQTTWPSATMLKIIKIA